MGFAPDRALPPGRFRGFGRARARGCGAADTVRHWLAVERPPERAQGAPCLRAGGEEVAHVLLLEQEAEVIAGDLVDEVKAALSGETADEPLAAAGEWVLRAVGAAAGFGRAVGGGLGCALSMRASR